MTRTTDLTRTNLVVADSDLNWLMHVLQAAQNAYDVTVVQTARPVTSLKFSGEGVSCAVVVLSSHDSAMDVRELLDRSPNVRFVFLADELPARPAVGRVIRERRHALLSRKEPPFIIAATAAALMAETGATP